jgi:hypothetical protein
MAVDMEQEEGGAVEVDMVMDTVVVVVEEEVGIVVQHRRIKFNLKVE